MSQNWTALCFGFVVYKFGDACCCLPWFKFIISVIPTTSCFPTWSGELVLKKAGNNSGWAMQWSAVIVVGDELWPSNVPWGCICRTPWSVSCQFYFIKIKRVMNDYCCFWFGGRQLKGVMIGICPVSAQAVLNTLHKDVNTRTSFIDKLNRGRQSASRKWHQDVHVLRYPVCTLKL